MSALAQAVVQSVRLVDESDRPVELPHVHPGEPMRAAQFNAVVDQVNTLSLASGGATALTVTGDSRVIIDGDLDVKGRINGGPTWCPAPQPALVTCAAAPAGSQGWHYDAPSAIGGAVLAALLFAVVVRTARRA